ncbi:hypothetical protein LCGC14_1198120, partial [marine sediment metagenome]
ESHPSHGRETSSRNSEVIHAGIYYVPGSLKAKTCTSGAHLLYGYCQEHSVPHKRTGKLIVATAPDELPALEALYDNARANGVEGLKMLEGPDIRKLEPRVTAIAAIHCPGTGILNVHTLMDRLYQQALDSGVTFGFNSKVTAISPDAEGYVVGMDEYRFHSKVVINSAGLCSDTVAAMCGIDVDEAGFEKEMEQHQETSRAGGEKFKIEQIVGLPATDDEPKYDEGEVRAKVLGWVTDGKFIKNGELNEGSEAAVVLDRTNFYGEAGGQVGDTGTLQRRGLASGGPPPQRRQGPERDERRPHGPRPGPPGRDAGGVGELRRNEPAVLGTAEV